MNKAHPIVRKWIAPPKLPEPINPALVHHAEQRAAQTQNRIVFEPVGTSAVGTHCGRWAGHCFS